MPQPVAMIAGPTYIGGPIKQGKQYATAESRKQRNGKSLVDWMTGTKLLCRIIDNANQDGFMLASANMRSEIN